MIQNRIITANITLNPVGEKMMRASSLRGKIVQTIGKCTGIMGGRIQFAPTIILKILLILIQNLDESTQKPTKTNHLTSVKSNNP